MVKSSGLNKGDKEVGESAYKPTLKRKVVNLSSEAVDHVAINVLSKGMGFAMAPKNLPIEKMICSIEDGISNLPLEDK